MTDDQAMPIAEATEGETDRVGAAGGLQQITISEGRTAKRQPHSDAGPEEELTYTNKVREEEQTRRDDRVRNKKGC